MTGHTVWLASYPKSGNTWFRAVFTAWESGGDVGVNALGGGPIASAREAFDDALGVPSADLTADEIDDLRPRVDEARDDEATGPRLAKIHDALFTGLAGDLVVSVAATRAAVYVIRDPRDVAVSFAHHSGVGMQRSVDRLCDPGALMGGTSGGRLHHQLRQRLGTWSDHVTSWVDQERFPMHVVRYEDAHTHPIEVFGAALRFAGFDASEPEVDEAVERASFDRLRVQEVEHGFRERPVAAEQFFRRGAVGTWQDELPAELARRIEHEHADVMRRFGYL